MATSGWIETGREDHDPMNGVAALLRGAVRGDSLERLLSAAARELLEAGCADRAGAWLLSGYSGDSSRTLDGFLVESTAGLIPEQWMSLDLAQPDLLELLEGGADDVLLQGAGLAHANLAQLSGISKTLWLPLRIAGEPVGLALVAWRRDVSAVQTPPLRALADTLSLLAGERRFREASALRRELPGESNEMRIRALEAEAQLVSVADAADSGMVLFDGKSNVRLLNDRFAQLLGVSRQSLVSARTWRSLAAAVSDYFEEPSAFMSRWAELADHPAEASCEEFDLASPPRRRLERFARPVVDSQGNVVGRLEVYRDVTIQKVEKSKSLQTEKMAGLGQLVSGIAHELNNPLTSIMGYSQLLLGRRLTSPQAADGRLIYQEAERAARIVKNLLLFARETRPERHAVNLNEILERTLALRNYELRVENIELSQDLDPRLPPVIADAAQLQQVLLNLLVNAEQAIRQGTSEGKISICTRLTPHGRVSFQIADTGPGIPPEIIPRIFDPFFSTKPTGAGTGLGLSITYSIVKEHGGEISVESKPGHGAKFTIELPAAIGVTVPDHEPSSNHHGVAKAILAPPSARILVIEDEPTVAHLIADVLGEEGHPVEIILDGHDGLNRIGAGEHDLVICDLRMPHLDGRAIYRELAAKRSPMLHRLVFVTGDTLAPLTMEFLAASGVPFLAKPFLVEELKGIVIQALEAAEQPGQRTGNSAAHFREELPLREIG
jgi:two-component system NtrC family sensor kinase